MKGDLVSLLSYLKKMAMIEDYEVFEPNRIGITFNAPVFRLSHCEGFFVAFGYRVIEARVEVKDGGEVYVLVEEV